jgi:hypothetical protein
LDPFIAGIGEPLSQTVVVKQASDISGQGFRVTRRRQQSRDFVLGKLANATAIRRRNGTPARHRLGGRKTEPLTPTRTNKHTSLVIDAAD